MAVVAGTMRDRMKRETSRAIARSAQDLVASKGLAGVTVEHIANDAGVSVRTFFNYYSCKEEAVVGIPEEVIAGIAEQLRDRPPGESPAAALRAVVRSQVENEVVSERWRLRSELVAAETSLLPHYLAALAHL